MLNNKQTNNRNKVEWYTCQRCGFPYPATKMLVHNGLILCTGPGTVGCKDQPGSQAFRRLLDLPIEEPLRPLVVVDEDL